MKKLILSILSLVIIANINVAFSKNYGVLSSGPFYLDGGEIPASSYLLVKLPILPSGIYNVSCDLINPNYSKKYPVVIGINTYGIVNGFNSSSQQYLLDKPVNKLIIYGLYSQGQFAIYNKDNADAILLKNCLATFAT